LSNSIYSQAMPLRDFIAATAIPPGSPAERAAIDLAAPNEPVVHSGDRLMLSGWRLADGYAGLEPARRLDYRQTASLRAANVGWVAQRAELASRIDLQPPASGWLRSKNPLPRAKIFARAMVSADPARDISHIPLESTALVDQPVRLDEAAAGSVAILDDRPGMIRLKVQARSARLLFVSESFHPGWKAWIDGRPQPVLRVDGDFIGCLCPPGTTEVRFEFRPVSLAYGRILSVCGLGLLGGLALLHVVRRRSRAGA
jgi:hypothetical protein